MNKFCGVDWVEDHHDVAVIDAAGLLVSKRRITDDADGFAELLGMLESVGDTSNDPIPMAIETPRDLLVAAMRATGRPVYAINPMAVVRYRERHSVARSKSDHVDAMTLANILRTDAHMHRQLPADSDLVRSIAVLARAARDAACSRTRATDPPPLGAGEPVTQFGFRRANAFGNRLRTKDNRGDRRIHRPFSGHAALGVDIGNCDIA